MKDYIFSLEIKVRDYELDSEGIVNNANYLHYLEYTRHEFCEEAGFSFKAMEEAGLTPVVNRVEVDYKTPLKSGDVMLSCLWIERKGVRFVFHQDIYNKATNKIAVSAVISTACIENGKLSRGEKLFSAFATAEYKTFIKTSEAAFGVFLRIPIATPTGLFLMRSLTIFTFLGDMRI